MKPTHTRSSSAILRVSTNNPPALASREQTALNKQKLYNTLNVNSTSACPRGTTLYSRASESKRTSYIKVRSSAVDEKQVTLDDADDLGADGGAESPSQRHRR